MVRFSRPSETTLLELYMLKLREMYPNKFLRNQAEGKPTHVKKCSGPEGRGKRGTYLVRFSRPSETTLLYMLVK